MPNDLGQLLKGERLDHFARRKLGTDFQKGMDGNRLGDAHVKWSNASSSEVWEEALAEQVPACFFRVRLAARSSCDASVDYNQ